MNYLRILLLFSVTCSLVANPGDSISSNLKMGSQDLSTSLNKNERNAIIGSAFYCTGASLTYTSMVLSICLFAADAHSDAALPAMIITGIGGFVFNHTGLCTSAFQARKVRNMYSENSPVYKEVIQYRNSYLLGLLPMAGAITLASIGPPLTYSDQTGTIPFYTFACLCLVIKDVLWSKTAFGTVRSIRKMKNEASPKRSLDVTVSPAVYENKGYGMQMNIVF